MNPLMNSKKKLRKNLILGIFFIIRSTIGSEWKIETKNYLLARVIETGLASVKKEMEGAYGVPMVVKCPFEADVICPLKSDSENK